MGIGVLMTEVGQGYEFFEHTADIGIRATGATQRELFARMAQGLMALIAEDSSVQGRAARSIQLSADDSESLLLRWLQELLFWFSTENFLAADYLLDEITPTSLRGQIRGETYDPARHGPGREVKAITRYLLEVTSHHGRWRGQVIVDV